MIFVLTALPSAVLSQRSFPPLSQFQLPRKNYKDRIDRKEMMRKDWLLGFLGFLGVQGIYGILKGDRSQALWLL
ncbi:hypothetical protein D6817_04895 [Candidatus Pacearchaeota archaeon]|nr:MAG: hypothetical protein D6817_04895 [Candidatus Pacearchaeota archaeon]